MAINISDKYPGRSNPPSVDYPQGSIKNQTAPGARDGTPLDEAWANDKEGFFQSLLHQAGLTSNGNVDKVGSSQYFDALSSLVQKQDSGLVVFDSSGSFTWAVPDVLKLGLKKAKVVVTGGGGPGSSGGGRAGGGAGGTAIKIVDLTGVSSVVCVVGRGGVGVEGGGSSENGFASSFGSYCSATGGVRASAISANAGGQGGTGVGGDINLIGGSGADYGGTSASGSLGGASYWGGASRGATTGGENGFYGGGGAGAASGVAGSGGSGLITIEW